MMSLKWILICFSVASFQATAIAQELHELEKDLAYYADIMVNASKEIHRQRAHDQFYQKFVSALNMPASRTHHFESLEWLSSITPADSSFRLLTWQLKHSEDQYRYFGFIVPQDIDRPVIELKDSRSLRSEFGTHDQNTWYGALYYGIESFIAENGEQAYIILGFNSHNAATNQKVADVLTFTDSGIRLGLEIFMPGDSLGNQDIKQRIILEYADAAAGRMQFDRERELLVFDHVITIFTEGPNGGPLHVPDGSFHGYHFEDGRWHFIDKLFNVTVDKPPGVGRISEDKKRDIFGRPKN